MTNNEIQELADRAANDAIASIQDALNIPSGDYIRAEIQQGANHD